MVEVFLVSVFNPSYVEKIVSINNKSDGQKKLGNDDTSAMYMGFFLFNKNNEQISLLGIKA